MDRVLEENRDDFLYVRTARELVSWVKFIRNYRWIAVDTESDSYHHYQEKVCLIQMTAGGRDAIIDPLSLDTLDPLRDLFEDPTRIKIFTPTPMII